MTIIERLFSNLLSSGLVTDKVRTNITSVILALPPDFVDDIGLAYYLTALNSGSQNDQWSFARWAVDRLNRPEFDSSEVSIDRDALGIDLAVYCLATSETLESATSRLMKTSNGAVSNLETLAFVVGLASRMLQRLARSVPEDCFSVAEGKISSAKEVQEPKALSANWQIGSLKNEVDAIRKERDNLKEENADLRSEVFRLSNDNDRINELNQENARLCIKLKSKGDQIEALEKERDAFRALHMQCVESKKEGQE